MRLYRKIENRADIKPSVFYLMTSHHPPCQLNRTWEVNVFSHKIYICTRCFGQYLGIFLSLLFLLTSDFVLKGTLREFLLLCILPFPVIIDWLSQTLGFRESSNVIRIISGFIFGINLGILIHFFLNGITLMFITLMVIYVVYAGFVIVLLRRYDVLGAYMEPYEDFIASDLSSE